MNNIWLKVSSEKGVNNLSNDSMQNKMKKKRQNLKTGHLTAVNNHLLAVADNNSWLATAVNCRYF